MFSGRYTLEEDKFDGSYFIDRNPFYFEYIIDYFRTGKIKLERLSDNEMVELMEEIDFYQIESLKKLIEEEPFTWENGLGTVAKTTTVNQWDFVAKSSKLYHNGVHKFNIKINFCHTDRSGFVLGVYGDPNIGPGMYGSVCGFGLNASAFSNMQLVEQNKIRSQNAFDMILDCDERIFQIFNDDILIGRGNINDMMNRYGSVRIGVFFYYIGNSITITSKH